jgi:hypothetical protein
LPAKFSRFSLRLLRRKGVSIFLCYRARLNCPQLVAGGGFAFIV